MLTENGTVKTGTKFDEKMFKELNGTLLKLCILYVVMGSVFLAAGIAVMVVDALLDYSADFYDIFFIAFGAFFLFFGIFYRGYTKKANEAIIKMNRVEEVEFCDGYLMEKEYTDGELTSTNKVYYKWLVKIRETKNYLFLYNTRVTAIAVDKNGLPLNELNIVRALLGRPVALPAAQGGQSESNVPPEEPFTDITDKKE